MQFREVPVSVVKLSVLNHYLQNNYRNWDVRPLKFKYWKDSTKSVIYTDCHL